MIPVNSDLITLCITCGFLRVRERRVCAGSNESQPEKISDSRFLKIRHIFWNIIAQMSPSLFASYTVACAVFICCVRALAECESPSSAAGSTCAILAVTEICTCADGTNNVATLTCSVGLLGHDQMSLIGTVQPCSKSGATIDLSVQDTKFNVSYTFPQFVANTNGFVPIPGMDFPTVIWCSDFLFRTPDQIRCVSGISLATTFGGGGVYANYTISGDTAMVTFDVNIDVCFEALFLKKCASKVVPGMPLTLIKGKYDFSSICS
jgi:hypothetical protein